MAEDIILILLIIIAIAVLMPYIIMRIKDAVAGICIARDYISSKYKKKEK